LDEEEDELYLTDKKVERQKSLILETFQSGPEVCTVRNGGERY